MTAVPTTLPQPSWPPSAAPTAKNRIAEPRYTTAKGMSSARAAPVFNTSNGATPNLASSSSASRRDERPGDGKPRHSGR
jgi:hypothetical protein